MSSDLTDALNRILHWTEQHKPQYVQYLYPGLSKDEIDDLVRDLPIQLPPELYELYQWRNGARLGHIGQETAWLFGNWTFTPLQEVVAQYQKELSKKQFWRSRPTKTVPYFRYFQGVEIFYSLRQAQSAFVFIKNTLDFCPVIFEDFEEGGFSIFYKYSSLTNMMLTMAECYETGAYFIEPEDQGGYFIICHPEKEHQIWHKYNSEIIEFALQSLEPTALCSLFFLYFSNDLIQFKDLRFVEPLIESLQLLNHQNADRDSLVKDDPDLYFDPKGEVARILGELGDPKAVPVLIATLKDDYHNNWDYQTKVSAAKALGQIKDERATLPLIEALINTLEDSESEEQQIGEWGLKEIRQMVAWALGEIGDIRAVEPLIDASWESDREVRKAASEALIKLISKFPELDERIPF